MTTLSSIRNTLEISTVESIVDSDYTLSRVDIAGNQDRDNKTYSYSGDLEVTTGTKRIYMTRTGAWGEFDMFVETAPVGADINIDIKKNGSTTIVSGSITDGSSSSINNSISTSSAGFVSGDYFTVDITQVGSTTAGADLYINLRITG